MQPEKKFRIGPVSATVWKNQGQKGSFSTVQLQRGYKDAKDVWQNTNSLRVSDLPRAVLALNKAYEYLALKQQDETTEEQVS
ncbi:hypothetical protein J4475_01125 [Candidatus Woesearchaeota archaeon]|nr:hypothetical protein [Candidatus Woesearchaeota archaeon]